MTPLLVHNNMINQILLLGIFITTMAEEQQCSGSAPMKSVASFMGMTLDYDLADRICCHNHVYAEPSGYQEKEGVGLFEKLDPKKETVFYDSVCGLPLFVAPRGRTFEEFEKESLRHGWPSFRPEEIVSENLIIHKGGRMESKCGTHLGHNLPEGGHDRYCIDLVCIAGTPPGEKFDHGTTDVITATDFDATKYESSAEQWSGKYPKTNERIMTGAAVIVPLSVVVMGFIMVRNRYLEKKRSLDANVMTRELSHQSSFDSDEEGKFT